METQAEFASAEHTTQGAFVHGSVPEEHLDGVLPTQAPLVQVWLAVHAWPQLPQLLVLLCRFVSQPSLYVALQSPKFVMHDAITQDPAAHPAVPLGTVEQAAPQAPQLAVLVATLSSQPSLGR
jgi:hypothetical protein